MPEASTTSAAVAPADAAIVPGGVWPVMLTPFLDNGDIDWQGVDALVDWYVDAGVAGIFTVCLSSEMYHLTPEERLALAQRVVSKSADRVPVIAAGAFAESINAQAEQVKRLADTGLTAVVITVNQLAREDESDETWKKRAESLFEACSDIPLGFYECPRPYHRLLSPDLLGWVAQTGRALFLKDTSCNRKIISSKLDVIKGTPLKWFNANCSTLLHSLQAGGDGYSGIAANFYPELFVRLCSSVTRDSDEAERLHRFLTVVDRAASNKYSLSAKYFLNLRGLPVKPICRRETPALTEEDRYLLTSLLEMVKEKL